MATLIGSDLFSFFFDVGSIECLINPLVRPLLEQYGQLLRADADTFPTPQMQNYYLDHVYMVICVICNFRHDDVQGNNAAYATRYARIKLSKVSQAAHLKHVDISNVASTYYGPPALV